MPLRTLGQPLVDVSCAPAGTFLCYEDERFGWDWTNHRPMYGGCDVRSGTEHGFEPNTGACNEPAPGAAGNCEKGYDCRFCGVAYSLPSGERLTVPATQCSDTGSGCLERLHNFDCCEAYCDIFGKTGAGCEPCDI